MIGASKPRVPPPNWQRSMCMTIIGVTVVFGCQKLLKTTGWPLQQQIIVCTALSAAILLVVLIVNWRMTRPFAMPPAPGYWAERPHQAGMLVFIIPAFSGLDELVDKVADKALHLSVSAFLFALSLFLGWLTYRLLIPLDARDAARNAMAKGQS